MIYGDCGSRTDDMGGTTGAPSHGSRTAATQSSALVARRYRSLPVAVARRRPPPRYYSLQNPDTLVPSSRINKPQLPLRLTTFLFETTSFNTADAYPDRCLPFTAAIFAAYRFCRFPVPVQSTVSKSPSSKCVVLATHCAPFNQKQRTIHHHVRSGYREQRSITLGSGNVRQHYIARAHALHRPPRRSVFLPPNGSRARHFYAVFPTTPFPPPPAYLPTDTALSIRREIL